MACGRMSRRTRVYLLLAPFVVLTIQSVCASVGVGLLTWRLSLGGRVEASMIVIT